MSSNNMYNILNTLKSLEPAPEQTVKAPAKPIYESVEARGSVLSGVEAVQAKLEKQLAEAKHDVYHSETDPLANQIGRAHV